MRRRKPQPILVLAFVLLMGAVMYVKDLPNPEPVLGLKVATGRLKVYYTEQPPGAGWRVQDITIQGNAVWVDFAFPQKPGDRISGALGARCPNRSDAVWKVLLQTQDIEVRGLTPEGRVIAAISCRALPKS